MVNGLAPACYPGSLSGELRIDGQDIRSMKSWEIGQFVGSVFQDPKSQFFSSLMSGETAFASIYALRPRGFVFRLFFCGALPRAPLAVRLPARWPSRGLCLSCKYDIKNTGYLTKSKTCPRFNVKSR